MQGPKGWTGNKEDLLSTAATTPSGNQHCTISTEADPNSEIRTKVFRMGAPLLRSTIPVSLGTPRMTEAQLMESARGKQDRKNRPKTEGVQEEEDSDVETVLSLSDVGIEDQGTLSVTMDFPC